VLCLGYLYTTWSIGSYHSPSQRPPSLGPCVHRCRRSENGVYGSFFFSASVSSPLGGEVVGRPAFSSPRFRSSILTRVWMSVLPAYPYFRFYAFVDLSITSWDHVCCCSLGASRIRCIFRRICKSLTLDLYSDLSNERIATPIFFFSPSSFIIRSLTRFTFSPIYHRAPTPSI